MPTSSDRKGCVFCGCREALVVSQDGADTVWTCPGCGIPIVRRTTMTFPINRGGKDGVSDPGTVGE